MKKILYILGYIFSLFQRFNGKCLMVYKNVELRKLGHWAGCDISEKVILRNPQNIFVGKGSYINGGFIYAGEHSRIVIGEKCLISYNVHIRTESHNCIPIKEQGEFEKDIIIGDNVWLGFGVQILPGITIGDGAIIGAGSVVTKNIPAYQIWAGVPAKFIKDRKQNCE